MDEGPNNNRGAARRCLMVAHRAGALTVAVVAVAMLVAIGSWEIYQGAEALAQPRELQFKCYQLTQLPAVGEVVTLDVQGQPEPQFPDEVVEVQSPALLCSAVTKIRGEEVTEPSEVADLLCYKIVPTEPPARGGVSLNVDVRLNDQFLTNQVATVTSPELLCIQVEKDIVD
jgi:hypothetical protein